MFEPDPLDAEPVPLKSEPDQPTVDLGPLEAALDEQPASALPVDGTESSPNELDAAAPVVPLRRAGCLLGAITGALGAVVGALVAGLILLIALSGDDGGSSRGERVDASLEGDALSGDSPEVVPAAGSTGDSDFWSRVLAETDLLGGASGGSSENGDVDLSPADLADAWSRMLTGESNQPGAPLGSRIEGINVKAVLDAVQESVVIVKAPTADSPEGGGSGFVVSADGHIVTNEHVIRDALSVEVRLSGGELVPAEVVASDPTRDLAVLSIDRSGLAPVRLGSTEGVEVGDEVIAIGNAFGIAGEPSVTSGIVSGLNRDIQLDGGKRLVRLIQTDAAINPGNSGGPLVNAAGEVIGINTAILGGFAEGIGYAISIDHAQPIIDQLLGGNVQARAYLGVGIISVDDVLAEQERVQSEDPDAPSSSGDGTPETVEPGQGAFEDLDEIVLPPGVTSGAYVASVAPGHAAERAGIVVGEVIVSFFGAPILSSQELIVEILARVPGDRIELGVIGIDGSLRTVDLELGEFPDNLEG